MVPAVPQPTLEELTHRAHERSGQSYLLLALAKRAGKRDRKQSLDWDRSLSLSLCQSGLANNDRARFIPY